MFSFKYTADLQLASPVRGLASREGVSAEETRGVSRRALDNPIDPAKAVSVDCVVFAGDIYNRNWKDYNTGLWLRSRMVLRQEAGIPVCMIAGNHDSAEDHIEQYWQGGRTIPENARLTHRYCNSTRTRNS